VFSSTLKQNIFVIQHYAGDVTYNVKDFLEKNRDTFFEDLKILCQTSQNPVLKALFSNSEPSEGSAPTRGNPKARPTTASSQFQKSIGDLLKVLYACEPHYIRTIKPNDEKRPLGFDEKRVLEQARYLGLLENLQVRRAGFCYRTTYERWLKRYGVVSDKTFPRFIGNARQGVEIVMADMGFSSNQFSMGKTKIFIREPQSLYNAEDARLRALDKIALKAKGASIKAKIVENNIILEYIQILIFEELDEFVILRPPGKNGEDNNVHYKRYQDLENDYISGAVNPNELKASLIQLLVDVSEPIREHFEKKKEGFFSGFLKFFSKGKTSTASLSAPK